LRNVFKIFGNIYSERDKNLLQDLTNASVSQIGARLWTIEYQVIYSREMNYLVLKDTPENRLVDWLTG